MAIWSPASVCNTQFFVVPPAVTLSLVQQPPHGGQIGVRRNIQHGVAEHSDTSDAQGSEPVQDGIDTTVVRVEWAVGLERNANGAIAGSLQILLHP
jgi:hypothetical protein